MDILPIQHLKSYSKNKKYENRKKYQTGLSEGHRPDLQPNGKVVRCVEDKGNGYLVVTSEDEKQPNTWLLKKFR